MIKQGTAVDDMTCDFKVVKFSDSNLKGIKTELTQSFLVEIFYITLVVSCHTMNPNLKNFRIPHHRVFSGKREGSLGF